MITRMRKGTVSREPKGRLRTRALTAGAACMALALSAATSAPAFDRSLPVEASAGDSSRGFMSMPIYRAGATPDEFLVLKTPGDCQRSVQVTMAWNEEDNWVRIHLKGKGVLEPYPTVTRTEGVDFFSNQFWPEAQSFENGRYLLWFITSPSLATFYYDATTLELLGSEYDFESPPQPSIPIQLPVFTAIPTPFFQPDEDGDIDVVWEYEYDGLVRPDRPDLSHTLGTFLPHTLCKTDPYRYDRSSTRPYSVARPASEAKTWRDYLENGLIFDLTVEPPEYFTDPPTSTNVGTYQGTAVNAGGVPKGWGVDFEAFFGSLAPPLRPIPTAPFQGESCEDWFKPQRNRDFDICGGGAQ
jgi:hypothetical protein